MSTLEVVAVCYLSLNLIVSFLLHLHGLRQPHEPLRSLDVATYFLLFTALAMPILLYGSAEALFADLPKGQPGDPLPHRQ